MTGISNRFLEINGVYDPPKTTTTTSGGTASGSTSTAGSGTATGVSTSPASATTQTETLLNTPTAVESQLGLANTTADASTSGSSAPYPYSYGQTTSPPAPPPAAQGDYPYSYGQTTSQPAPPPAAQEDSAPLQIGSLDASDRKFFAMSPNEGALEEFDQTYTAQVLVEGVNENTAVIRDGDNSMDDRRGAVRDASTQVESLSEIDNVEIRNAALEIIQPDLVTLGEGIDVLGGNDTSTVIGQLTRATENLGIQDAQLIANPIAHGLHVGTHRHPSNPNELSNGITESIENGDGALFATLVANNLTYDREVRNIVSEAGAEGIRTLNDGFNDARDEKEALERQIADYIFEFGDTLSETELQDGIDAVVAENQQILDDFEAAAGKLATTFNGVSVMPAGATITESGDQRIQLWAAGGAVRQNIDDALNTEAGLNRLANAIEESESGTENFYTEFTDFFTSVTDPQEAGDQFADTVLKAVAFRADQLVSDDNYEGAARLFRGFEQSAPLFQVDDPEKLAALTTLLENQANPATRLSSADFAVKFNEQAGDIEGRLGAAGTSRAGRGLQVLALAVGASAIAGDLTLNDIDAELALRSTINASELSDDLVGLLPEGRLGREFLEKFAKLSRAGAIFDAVEIYRAVQRGDKADVGFGVAGLVGTILTTTSVGGPAGTAIGAALSLFAVGGSIGWSQYQKNQAEDRAEEGLGTFLSGAGFSDEEVELLRDVRGDTHESIGRIFTQIADSHPDLSPRDVLELLLNPGSHRADEFGGVPLASGEIEFTDNRRRVIDEIEKLERGEDGNFTRESVRKAIAIFETSLGVNIRADGLTTETALQGLDDEFGVFDLNDDGQVSDDELRQIAEDPLNGAAGPLTPEQTEQQNLANFFLDRSNLFHRLDVGGGSGSGNDKISRQDIEDVQEQNQHLNVLRQNLDVFDVGKYPDSDPDGLISKEDLRRIRDGDYPDELTAAARFILDNDDLFDFIETGQQRAELRDIDFGSTEQVNVDGDTLQADVQDAWLTLNG